MTTRAPIATRLGQFGRGHRFFRQPLPKCCRPSVELTTYKSYSIPAGVLGAFAVSHANVWRCGRKVTPVPPLFRLHPHLACRLPYRFPRGRFTRLLRIRVPAPWLPYRFPRGRLGVGVTAFRQQPWLPYRFPRGRLRAGATSWNPSDPRLMDQAETWRTATKTADWLRILRRTISCRSRFLSESFASACKRAITLCR
jgi:hypothetical protein